MIKHYGEPGLKQGTADPIRTGPRSCDRGTAPDHPGTGKQAVPTVRPAQGERAKISANF